MDTVTIQIPIEMLNTLKLLCKQLDSLCNTDTSLPKDTSLPIVSSSISTSPTLEEVVKFCKERNSTVNPNRFYSYYSNLGWKTKTGIEISDWKMQFISWESNSCVDSSKVIYSSGKTDVIHNTKPAQNITQNIKNLNAMLEAI